MLSSIKKYLFRKRNPVVISDIDRLEPLNRNFGFERGTPVDRYYIEKFLNEKRNLIRGNVLEISENTYTEKFGSNVSTSSILTFDKNAVFPAIFGDLTDRTTLPLQKFDCFIATQTLNFIKDIETTVENSNFLLSPGGVFLGTVASLTQISKFDYDRWGDYWRFTDMGLKTLLEKHFSKVKVYPKGNFAAARCLLDGLAVEDLKSKDFLDIVDVDYSILIAFEAYK